jgi:hypothetical protein
MDAYLRTRALADVEGRSPAADAMRLVGDFVAHREYEELLTTFHHVMRCLRAIRTHRTSGNTMAENVEDMRYALGCWNDAAWEMRDALIMCRGSRSPLAPFAHGDVVDDLRCKALFMDRVIDLCYGYVAAIEERLDWCPGPSEEEDWFGWTTYVPEEVD